MGAEVTAAGPPEHADWPSNYWNYFTETEEHFQRARGTSLFRLSPLDWALVEAWKNAGVPLEAVLRGIDEAFARWRSRKQTHRMINSLAYCTQAVMEQARLLAGAAPAARPVEPPFTADQLQAHLHGCAQAVREKGRDALLPVAEALERLASEAGDYLHRLEELEQRLTALEDKILAMARFEQSEEDLFQARRQLEGYLRPYRGKMTAEQLAMLEKQFLDRRLFESLGLPRLSLFYLK